MNRRIFTKSIGIASLVALPLSAKAVVPSLTNPFDEIPFPTTNPNELRNTLYDILRLSGTRTDVTPEDADRYTLPILSSEPSLEEIVSLVNSMRETLISFKLGRPPE